MINSIYYNIIYNIYYGKSVKVNNSCMRNPTAQALGPNKQSVPKNGIASFTVQLAEAGKTHKARIDQHQPPRFGFENRQSDTASCQYLQLPKATTFYKHTLAQYSR